MLRRLAVAATRPSVRLAGASPLRQSTRCLASSSTTILAALIERSPQLTPDPSELEQQQIDMEAKLEMNHKVYPTSLTSAEEGPDQQRARLRLEGIVERESTREGEGDRSGDEASHDRQLQQRVYLVVRDSDGTWRLPQRAWAGPPESARDGLLSAITNECGESLNAHQMGNAPLGHLALAGGEKTLFVWRFLHVSGQADPEWSGLQHAWLTKEELAQRVDADLGELSHLICGPFP